MTTKLFDLTPEVGSQVRMYGGAEYKVLLVGRLHGKRAVAVKWEDNAPHWIYLSQLPLEEK